MTFGRTSSEASGINTTCADVFVSCSVLEKKNNVIARTDVRTCQPEKEYLKVTKHISRRAARQHKFMVPPSETVRGDRVPHLQLVRRLAEITLGYDAATSKGAGNPAR